MVDSYALRNTTWRHFAFLDSCILRKVWRRALLPSLQSFVGAEPPTLAILARACVSPGQVFPQPDQRTQPHQLWHLHQPQWMQALPAPAISLLVLPIFCWTMVVECPHRRLCSGVFVSCLESQSETPNRSCMPLHYRVYGPHIL